MADDYEGSVSNVVQRSFGPMMFKFPDGVNLLKPTQNGPIVFDIMPFAITQATHPAVKSGQMKVGENASRVYYARHYIGGKKNGTFVVCPEATSGKRCPVCEFRQKQADELAAKLGKPNLDKGTWPKELSNLFPNYRVAMLIRKVDDPETLWVLDQSASGPPRKDGTVNTKNFDYKFNTARSSYMTIRKLSKFPIFSPIEGHSVAVDVAMTTNSAIANGKQFAELGNITFIEREKQYTADIVKKSFDLYAAMNVLPYEEIERIMYGVEDSPEPEQDEVTEQVVESNKTEPVKEEPKEVKPVCPKGHKLGEVFLPHTGEDCEECTIRRACRAEQNAQNANIL